jgi:hypothetical protein
MAVLASFAAFSLAFDALSLLRPFQSFNSFFWHPWGFVGKECVRYVSVRSALIADFRIAFR